MKKTSTRLAFIGSTVILGACAIALAQHDSRKRERDTSIPVAIKTEDADPMAAPLGWNDSANATSAPSTSANASPNTVYASASRVVRGNNDDGYDPMPVHTASYDANPLRGGESDVVLAGANEGLGGLPALPPAYSGGNTSGANAPPTMGYGSESISDGPGSALQSLPAMPSLPTGGSASRVPSAPSFDALPSSDGPTYGAGPPSGTGYAEEVDPGLPPTTPLPSSNTLPSSRELAASSTNPVNATASYGGGGYGGGENSGSTFEDGQDDTYGASTSALSDTQRGAMSPTDLTRPSNGQPADPPSYGGIGQTAITQQAPASDSGLPSSPRPSSGASTQSSYGMPNSLSAVPTPAAPMQGDAATRAIPAAAGTLASLVSDKPGNRYLDGAQAPNVTIEIRAPGEEMQVGKKATFMILVSNRGNVDALDVTVVDKVPQGTRFVGSEPATSPTKEGVLVWTLGKIPPGEERLIRTNIVPEREGEVGSTASVMFAAQASVRTLATQPKLELEIEALPDVLIGDPYNVRMTVRNRGSGVARGVRIEVDIPENISHSSGRSIAANLPDLHPNESRPITNLAFAAVLAGQGQCLVRAVTEDGVQVEKAINLDVKAPKLVAQIQGPKERYLQRQATYTLAVKNTGTAPATNLEFAVHLPAGLKFIGSDKSQVDYDRARHAVTLGLGELPAGTPASFQLELMPVELGPQTFSMKATGDLGVAVEAQAQVDVKGRAELEFTVRQDNGAIEVGATTTYEVEILNKGDKPDRNVRLQVTLPEGSRMVNISPQGRHQQQGNTIVFEPIEEMPIRDARTYRFEVEHTRSGTMVIQSRLASENLSVGVLKEVPTFVYNDRE